MRHCGSKERMKCGKNLEINELIVTAGREITGGLSGIVIVNTLEREFVLLKSDYSISVAHHLFAIKRRTGLLCERTVRVDR